ncbi:MAG: hypothetical protein J1E02_01340 [Coprobacter sp.]|nr:hypothetical protein [Coprobacter sp.]
MTTEKLLTHVEELQNECEKNNVSYSLFIGDGNDSIAGAANLSLKEISILIENLARPLPAEQIQFLQHILSLVARDRQQHPEP